jgi:Ca2+-binding RTX toxin-like protein
VIDDIIIGSQGADIIQGNGAGDTLTGNGGADQFRYLSFGDSLAATPDTITDFTPGTDKIDLARIDANLLSPGDQAFSWIGSNAFSATGASSAGELRAFESNGSWIVQGDLNGDGIADLVINLTLQGQTPLGAVDFFL